MATKTGVVTKGVTGVFVAVSAATTEVFVGDRVAAAGRVLVRVLVGVFVRVLVGVFVRVAVDVGVDVCVGDAVMVTLGVRLDV